MGSCHNVIFVFEEEFVLLGMPNLDLNNLKELLNSGAYKIEIDKDFFRTSFCEHDNEAYFLFGVAKFVDHLKTNGVIIKLACLDGLENKLEEDSWDGKSEEDRKYVIEQFEGIKFVDVDDKKIMLDLENNFNYMSIEAFHKGIYSK